MNTQKVRVIRTTNRLFKFGARQPGCTAATTSECPSNDTHLCWDFSSYSLAIAHARTIARIHASKAARRRATARAKAREAAVRTLEKQKQANSAARAYMLPNPHPGPIPRDLPGTRSTHSMGSAIWDPTFGPRSPGETLAPLFTGAQLDARAAELRRITDGIGNGS